MEIKGLGFVPLLLTFWCVAWLSSSYTLTVLHGRAPPLMYISDTGSFFPENILFGIGFVGMSMATLGLTFLNYKFTTFHLEAFGARQHWIQKVLLAMAWSSCFGTAVTAIFSTREYPRTHTVTAITTFICGVIYYLWQATLLYKVPGTSRAICHIRWTCCAMAFACVLLLLASGTVDYIPHWEGDWNKIRNPTTMITEWVMLLLILMNILTYYPILQRLLLTVSKNSCTISLRVKIADFGV